VCVKIGLCFREKESCKETTCLYHERRKPYGISGGPENRQDGKSALAVFLDKLALSLPDDRQGGRAGRWN